MSEIASAPWFRVDGPLPQAPPYRLLDVATVVEEAETRFLAGVQVWGYPPATPSLWDPCADASPQGLKTEGEQPLNPKFHSFTVYQPIACSSLGIGDDNDLFRDRAIAALAATESFGVEQQLSQGLANPDDPFLGDTNADLLNGGAATAAALALALLEEAIGATARGGVIHATPGTVTAWDALGFTIEHRGSLLYTLRGTPIAVGDGYIGADPVDGASPGAGQAWAFASGPIQVRRTTPYVVPDTVAEALDREQNSVVNYAERDYVVDWDGELQAAVLVDWDA